MFAFDFFSANAVRLVPVKLSHANPTTLQANLRYALEFSPPTFAICSSQPSNVADAVADGYRFDVCNFADDLEVHLQDIKSNVLATFKVWVIITSN